MDNHKLVMISIFYFFKHEKDAWKNFRIWLYATKYFFFFENALNFFKIFQRKPGILIPDLYFTV